MPQNENNDYRLIGNNLFSLTYKEFYKSKVGPRKESLHVFVRYVEPEKINHNSINILEIGFGPGTNFFELLETLQSKKNKKEINYFAFENKPIDEKVIKKYLYKLKFQKKNINIFLNSYAPVENGLAVINFFHLNVNLFFFHGDFLHFAQCLSLRIDYFFLDPFSPKVNKEAWSKKMFQNIKKFSYENSVILTYSVAKNIQKNLLSIDFKVDLKKGIGQKKYNLLATAVNQNLFKQINNKKIVIIGAGISGILCAYYLNSFGLEVTVIDSNSEIMSDASSVPIAMVRPYFSPKDIIYNQFLFSSYLFALNFYEHFKKTNLKSGIKKHHSIFIPNKNFKYGDFFERILLEKKFINFHTHELNGKKTFIFKKNFSIHTKKFKKIIFHNLEQKVSFQFNKEIKKVKRKGDFYKLFDKDGKIIKADILIYTGGFKSSSIVINNLNLLKPSFGQQDYVQSFDNFKSPYLGEIYVNKINSKQFIIGTSYHDGISDDRFKENDSLMLQEKIKQLFPGIDSQKNSSWCSTRSITPDRRALFGQVDSNFYISTGLGSIGFTISPIMAFLVAKKILGIDLFKLNQFRKIDFTRFVSN